MASGDYRNHHLQPVSDFDDFPALSGKTLFPVDGGHDGLSVPGDGGNQGSNLLTMPAKVFERDTISDDYTYATVEETGIPGLGNIYITEEQKEELMNLNTLVNDLCRDKKVVDMTNQLSHYNILNRENLMPFSSTYNTNNKVMQTRAIEVLEEKQPELIIVARLGSMIPVP